MKNWNNWGDHPLIVTILLTTAVFAAYTGWAQLQASTAQTNSQYSIDPKLSTSPSPTTSPSTEPTPTLSPTPPDNTPTLPPKPPNTIVPIVSPTLPPSIPLMSPPERALNESDRLLHERKCQQHLATFSSARQNKGGADILNYCEYDYISIEVCYQKLVELSPTHAKVWQKLVAVDRSSGQRQTTIEDKNYTLVLEGSEWKVDSQDWNEYVKKVPSANCSTL